MKQLNLYYLGGGPSPSIPDGKTVTPVADVQIWLSCAGRKDAYTLLSQVLSDTVCLNALMQNENAVDYLVRSTAWISEITSNSDAMNYIGAYNYCADTLIDDDSWLSAIGQSTYVGSVLNVSVPQMTSDSAPYGVCSVDSRYTDSAAAYKAVDGVATTAQFDAWVSSSGSNHWWQYQFTESVKIVYMYISGRKFTGDANGQVSSFILKGSNDGVTFTDLTPTITRTVGQGVRTYHKVSTPGSYNRYRISNITNTIAGIGELQFYGRKDV